VGAAAAPTVAAFTLGHSVVPLNRPWKFHVGDDARWADPNFADGAWETVDLTPPPGAHDDDVGLSGYVPGWTANGHAGYWGYAWYRIRVRAFDPYGEPVSLAGPADVDGGYQLFVNGRLVGSSGSFAGATPTEYSTLPRTFALETNAGRGRKPRSYSALVALRVWTSREDAASPGAGGMHIAPVLGSAAGIDAIARLQWLELVRGFFLEILQAAVFVLLAVTAWSLMPFDRSDRAYGWLGAALVLTALHRANLAFFSWTNYESTWTYELAINVILIPLWFGAWTVAWLHWFALRRVTWPIAAAGALTLAYAVAQFVSGPMFGAALGGGAAAAVQAATTVVRLLFLALMVFIVGRGIGQNRAEGILALPAVVLVSIGLFAPELSAVDVPGIWFPFGTGVSRTQFAYAAFDVVMFALLLRRLVRFARAARPQPGPGLAAA
jgi:hypothetical protein